MTQNIRGIIDDLGKLRSMPAGPEVPMVVFPIYPVSREPGTRASQTNIHLSRIREAGGEFVREGLVVPPLSDGSWGIAWHVVAP